mgnify:CR=1 FL=1
MTNLQISEIPKNFDYLINLYHNLANQNTKMSVTDDSKFNVSFFDGLSRKTMIFEWNDLKNSVDFLENQLKFERKSNIQKKYDSFIRKIKESGNSIYEHILTNEMNLDNDQSIGEMNKFVLTKNKFPYDFGNHQHYVLWIHPNCDNQTKTRLFDREKCEKEISKIIKLKPDLSDQFIIFRNAPKNKSIATIEHFHVIFY